MKHPPIHYHDYLNIPSLLAGQKLRSEQLGKKAHDEMLFIIVHQTYELWFKQMLFELESVVDAFSQSSVPDTEMGTAVARLERMVEIQKFINGQIDILETMTPLDFLDFREYLYPASGFQSFQWRSLETLLGLKSDQRLNYNEQPFYKSLAPSEQGVMQKLMQSPSLFDLVEKWLERTPFLQSEGFDFWKKYQESVEKLFAEDRKVVETNSRLSESEKQRNLAQIEGSLNTFRAIFSEQDYKN